MRVYKKIQLYIVIIKYNAISFILYNANFKKLP